MNGTANAAGPLPIEVATPQAPYLERGARNLDFSDFLLCGIC
jgi:hypothetical protein